MGYNKIRYANSDVHIFTQDLGQEVCLLQQPLGTKSVLSKMKTVESNKQVIAKINCSYFDGSQVLGRNQGELINGTLDQHEGKVHYDYVITKTGEHFIGAFNSWDYQNNALVGFTPAVILIKDGIDVTLISTELSDMGKYTNKAPQTLFGVTNSNVMFMVMAEGRNSGDAGLTGSECRLCAKQVFGSIKHCVMLDSGGSSEMIVNDKVVNYCSDGSERSMCNGLAFIELIGSKMLYKTVHCDLFNLVIRDQASTSGKIIGNIAKGASQTFASLAFVPYRTSIDPATRLKYQVLEVWGSWIYNGTTYTHGYAQYDSSAYWIGL